MASTPPTTIEALDAEATGTRIVFEWRGDRFHHAIYSVCLGKATLLAESIEGDAVDSWPPSPPLQQLHKQPRDTGGEVLFATGMAGKSHWSGSISVADLQWTTVTFEFACRHREQPNWLGVNYRLAESVQAQAKGEEIILSTGDSLAYTLCPVAIPVSMATEFVPTSSVFYSGRIKIAAATIAHMTTSTTNRWAYSVQLTRSSQGDKDASSY